MALEFSPARAISQGEKVRNRAPESDRLPAYSLPIFGKFASISTSCG